MAERLAPAVDPSIGPDAQPDRVHALPAQPGHGSRLRPHVERNPGPVGLDTGDLHGFPPSVSGDSAPRDGKVPAHEGRSLVRGRPIRRAQLRAYWLWD